jgi:hypothetical protein
VTATIVTGLDPDGLPYTATLNGDRVPVRVQPDALLAYTPDQGAPVVAGPCGLELSFNLADPASVYAWLLGSTDVISIEGPGLIPDVPGDLILDDGGQPPPDDGEPTEPTTPDTTRPDDMTHQPGEGAAMADTSTIDPAETAPVVEVGPEDDGEMRLNFPIIVIEGLDTSDGRYLEPGSVSLRALPLTLHAQLESAHGGDQPGPSIAVGRVDTMTRRPGPEVISPRTGQPFPEGTFVWSGTGAVSTTATIDGNNVADWVRRKFLRGVSADLAGMDYDMIGADGMALDPDNPRRELVAHGAEFAGLTLVSIPAFGDCYAEVAGDTLTTMQPLPVEDLAELGLVASAVPSWRSPEVGDRVTLVAAADEGIPVRIPPDSVEQLAQVIGTADGQDPTAVATSVVEHIAQNWALEEPIGEDELPAADPGMTAAGDDIAAAPAQVAVTDTDPAGEGMPEDPQPCALGDGEPATMSLVYRDGDAYVPACDEHLQQARDELDAAGETIDEEVPIGPADDEDEPETDDEEEAPMVASGQTGPRGHASAVRDRTPVTAAAAPVDVFLDQVPTASDSGARPPLAWFTDPGLTEYTPITVDGRRVYGHIGPWNVRHIGIADKPVYLPKSRSGYRHFLRGGVRVEDRGAERIVAVGHLTASTRHAEDHLAAGATARHYDHSGYSWAYVAAGEDEFGVWVSGMLAPGVTDDQLTEALAHPPSGDWRNIDGNLELVGVLCVNVPGFGVDRARVASGQMVSLIASGEGRPRLLGHEIADADAVPVGFDPDQFADRVADRIEQRRAAAELATEHAALISELDATPDRFAELLEQVDTSAVDHAAVLAELDGAGEFLSKMPPQLQKEWLTGKVGARIAWGTPHAMTRCIAEAKKHNIPERERGGLCQNLKKIAEPGV